MAEEKRLIDANELRTQFDDIPPYIGLAGSLVQQYIDKAHAVDAVEVVHGHWINWGKSKTPTYENYGTCSVCHEDAEICTRNRNYCPNCGAKMDTQRRREPVKEANMRHIRDFEDKQESGLLEED